MQMRRQFQEELKHKMEGYVLKNEEDYRRNEVNFEKKIKETWHQIHQKKLI